MELTAGLVLLGPADSGPFTPAAVWPDRRIDATYLSATAEQALRERRGIVKPVGADGNASHVAYPLEISGHLHGVVVLDVATGRDERLQQLLRNLHWGTGRLETLLAQEDTARALQIIDRLVLNLDLVTVVGEHPELRAACRALVTEVSSRLGCDRVSIGFVEGDHSDVLAVSHSAQFKDKANVVRALARRWTSRSTSGSASCCRSRKPRRHW